MEFAIRGTYVEINEMKKPEGVYGSVFQFDGTDSLNQLGLKKTVYFQAPDKFSITTPDRDQMQEATSEDLALLAYFLHNCIAYERLVSQFDELHPMMKSYYHTPQ